MPKHDRKNRRSSTRIRVMGVRAVLTVAMLAITTVVMVVVPTGTASAEPAPPTSATRDAAGCAGPPAALRPNQTLRRSLVVGGVTRTYRVHVPSDYDGRTRVPLVLAFHGHAEKGTAFETYTQLSRLPAIVVYPDGLRGPDRLVSWQGAPYSSPAADDLGFTAAILRDIRSTTCTDRARTFAVGRSNGGGFVALLSCRMPSEFAAYATVSAAIYLPGYRRCPSAPPVSMITFHGTDDQVIHYGGGTKHGAGYLSATQWVEDVIRRDRCARASATTPINAVVTQRTWPVCARATMVTHIRINGGSHRWPGSTGNRAAGLVSDTISATDLIWSFFTLRAGRV